MDANKAERGSSATNLQEIVSLPPSGSLSTCIDSPIHGVVDDLTYETSLPLRFDLLSSLVYPLGVPGALLLLLSEHHSDFVRFHAWQAFLLAFGWLVLQASLRGLVGVRVGWMSIVGVMGGGWIGWRAYRESARMRIFQIPCVGPLALEFVRSELRRGP